MADQYVGSGFADYIGTRTKPGQNQFEYYNKENNMAFGTPQELFGYASTVAQKPIGSFDDIRAGFTPRAQALETIKNDLNAYQNNAFNAPEPSNKRASSSITESIAIEDSNYNSLISEYNDLRKKLTALSAPNYQDEYNKLRESQGIPGIEKDFADNQKTIRELPYVNRQNLGNAGVTTEGQLAEDTYQKGIPLEIQQANLLDRLKLAGDFVSNSLKFKELDANASRQSLADAIDTVVQTINFSRTHLNDLLGREKDQQERQQLAEQFAFENRITKPFYDIGGTVYRTSDRMPAHNKQEYIAMGGTGDFSDVQKLDAKQMQMEQSEQEMVMDLASKYPDAGIVLTDSYATAQSKLGKSKIYKDQVRGPQGPQTSVSERLLLRQSGILSDAGTVLDNERGSSGDGYANPNTYRKYKRDFIANAGTPQDFEESYPVEVYIHPNNRKGDLAEKSSSSGLDPAVAAFLGINQ